MHVCVWMPVCACACMCTRAYVGVGNPKPGLGLQEGFPEVAVSQKVSTGEVEISSCREGHWRHRPPGAETKGSPREPGAGAHAEWCGPAGMGRAS